MTYILRDIPPGVWATVKARAKAEGIPLRTLFLTLLTHYANGPLPPMPRVIPESTDKSTETAITHSRSPTG